MKRVTLKDIAQICGVTPTLVSAVLNNRLGKITCIPEKKELILKTARELGYQVNVFARSMVKKHIPVAALMFHHGDEDNLRLGSSYFAQRASQLTYSLEEHNIESLLVFYRSEEEQIRKLESLWNRGMIGGVISNIFPFSHLAFTSRLKELKIPHVVMGAPKAEVLCVSSRSEYSFLRECKAHYGAKRVFLLQGSNAMLYPWHDVPGYYRFDYEPLPATPELTENPENLIVFLGAEYYLLSEMKFARPIILEEEQRACLLPENVPHILFSGSTGSGAEMAAQLLAQWMCENKVPEKLCHEIPRGAIIKKAL